MTTITFEDARALSVFQSMAEGMEEVQRDNGDAVSLKLADALIALIEFTADAAVEDVYPMTVELPDELIAAAEVTLDNSLDSSAGMTRDDDDAEDYLFDGQVAISR